MPIYNSKPSSYKKAKEIKEEWTTFRKGLNLLLRPTELGKDEMAQADNIMLVGSGVPTGRWGSSLYFAAGATGSIRGFGTYKNNAGTTNEVFVLTDQGYLQKKNGSSSTQINGQSWPSGSTIRAEQLGGKTYIVSSDVAFTEYNGSALSAYLTISPPTGLSATNFSGATGPNSVSYKVQALGPNGGQTPPSANYLLTDLPSDIAQTQIHLFWTAPSAASLSGFEIFRGKEGDETWLAGVPPDSTQYVDDGLTASQVISPSLTNTTGGVKSEFIIKYKDRLVVVNKDDPNFLMISGKYPNHTKFNWLDGGGGVYVDPDSGDNITGLAVQPIADRLVAYKNYSSYLIEVSQVQIGPYYVLDPQYTPISTTTGCSNHDTIQTVENDTFYFGRKGIYVTGYEPNFLNIIRTNEISARIRPYFENMSESDYSQACALYANNKYLLSFPTKEEVVVYDRERGSFAGIWKLPFGISHMKLYVDGDGNEKWLIGSNTTNNVYSFEVGVRNDAGQKIEITMRTAKVDFGDWTLLSILQFFYTLFRAVIGTVSVNILVETRTGATVKVKSFEVSGAESIGSTGYGNDGYGLTKYGLSNSLKATTVSDEITKWGSIFKQARLAQVEIKTNAANSNFEILKIMFTAKNQSRGSLSSNQRV